MTVSPADATTARPRTAPDVMSLARIRELVAEEERTDADVLHLTANETVLSPLARGVLSSPLSTRYLLEHLDMRQDSPSRLSNLLYRGLDRLNEIEASATAVCRELFGAEHVEFRCLSGLHAMQTTIASLTEPGDSVMRVATHDGGHFLTELICRRFGRRSCTVVFDPDDPTRIDLDATAQVIARERPAMLYLDAMNYLFPFPLARLREICGDTLLVYDASHTFGLIGGGQFQDPLAEGADILQANTHKTFFGPQKGIILSRDRGLMERIGYTLSSGMVSSQHTASSLALFVALHELYQDGRPYARQVMANARHLAGVLAALGVSVLDTERGFTGNHMFFVDTRPLGGGPEALRSLLRANISANRVVAFARTDALRFGVQEITRLGYDRSDLDLVASLVARVLVGHDDPTGVRRAVVDLVRSRRSVGFTGAGAGDAAPPPDRGAGATTVSGAAEAERRRVTAGLRPRWIGTDLEQAPVTVPPRAWDAVTALGRAAGAFPHQIDSAGNLSISVDGRLFVTASGAYIRDLADGDLVEVLDQRGWTLRCRGAGPPSVEAYLHVLLARRLGATCVVHNHCIPAGSLQGLGVAVIDPLEYGSIALAEAVARAAERNQEIYVRRHGLVFWGRSADELFPRIERIRRATEGTGRSAPASGGTGPGRG